MTTDLHSFFILHLNYNYKINYIVNNNLHMLTYLFILYDKLIFCKLHTYNFDQQEVNLPIYFIFKYITKCLFLFFLNISN